MPAVNEAGVWCYQPRPYRPAQPAREGCQVRRYRRKRMNNSFRWTDGKAILGMYPSHLQGPGADSTVGVRSPRRLCGALTAAAAGLVALLLAKTATQHARSCLAARPLRVCCLSPSNAKRSRLARELRFPLRSCHLCLFRSYSGPSRRRCRRASPCWQSSSRFSRISRCQREHVERPYLRWLVWTSERVVTAVMGGLAAQACHAQRCAPSDRDGDSSSDDDDSCDEQLPHVRRRFACVEAKMRGRL